MAIPFIFPLIAALAGTGLQMAGASKARSEAERATRNEIARQQRLRQEAEAAALMSREQSTPENVAGQIQGGQQQAVENYDKVGQVPLSASATVAPAQRSSSAVNDKRNQEQTKASNQARGNVVGYNEWELQRQIKNLLAQSQLGTIGNFSRGSQGVLGLELQAAQHAGDSLSGAGQLLGMLGSVASLGSLFSSAPTVAGNASVFAENPALGAALSGANPATPLFNSIGSQYSAYAPSMFGAVAPSAWQFGLPR